MVHTPSCFNEAKGKLRQGAQPWCMQTNGQPGAHLLPSQRVLLDNEKAATLYA